MVERLRIRHIKEKTPTIVGANLKMSEASLLMVSVRQMRAKLELFPCTTKEFANHVQSALNANPITTVTASLLMTIKVVTMDYLPVILGAMQLTEMVPSLPAGMAIKPAKHSSTAHL